MSGAGRTGIVHVDNVGMVEQADDLDLPVKPADHLVVSEQLLANELDGCQAFHFLVPRFEDLARSSFAEAVQKQVGSEQ